jgi:hypothetical protein
VHLLFVLSRYFSAISPLEDCKILSLVEDSEDASPAIARAWHEWSLPLKKGWDGAEEDLESTPARRFVECGRVLWLGSWLNNVV